MKKGLVQVMLANVVGLVIGILTNFLLPKYLSVDSYALVKTYTLYITYAGFFSLGYNDGMYLKYGGKDIKDIDKRDLANNYLNYSVLIFIMLVFVLIAGFCISDGVVIAFAFGMFSYNILGYLKSLYQATGEFRAYGRALNIEKVTIFIVTMLLIFVFHEGDSNYYIWIQVIIGILVATILTIKLERKLHFLKKGKIAINEFWDNISSGFILMLGNFSSSIFTGLDRWFVKVLLTSTHFAMYSFAVSMENIINVFTTPITISMYNYFCKRPSQEQIKRVKRYVLIWGIVIISAAFPAKFILEVFLQNYQSANSIIFLLFAAQIFNVVIKGIYVNIYKAEKKQNKYLKQMIIMICIGFVLNTVFYYIFRNMISIAAATLITSIIWLLTCELEKNNTIKYGTKEILAILLILAVYLITGYRFEAIAGCIIYILLTLIILFILMNDTMKELMIFIKQTIKSTVLKISKKEI